VQKKTAKNAFAHFFLLDALWLLIFIHLWIYKREIRSQRMLSQSKKK
jgi:flagellar biosynthesis/type III secretory pathway M-ring protein FliF/YscJ